MPQFDFAPLLFFKEKENSRKFTKVPYYDQCFLNVYKTNIQTSCSFIHSTFSIHRPLVTRSKLLVSLLSFYFKFQLKLHEESQLLHKYASECSSQLQNRDTPLWVRATVGLFRTYF